MITFNAANKWLKSRVNVPTAMGSRELAMSPDFEPKVRAHAFFSAKVAETHVLEKLRSVSDSYSQGKLGLAEARTMLKKYIGGADDVSSIAGKDPNKSITNLASTARLNLILRQNAAMANAVGEREIAMDPDILERFPYFTRRSRSDARPWHKAQDGLTLPKTDPYWNTHTPPDDYSCRCRLEDSDTAARRTGPGSADVSSAIRTKDGWKINNNGQLITVPEVPPSGYSFDISEAFETCDMSRIENLELRREAHDAVVKYCAKTSAQTSFTGPAASVVRKPGSADVSSALPPANVQEIKEAFTAIDEAVKAGAVLPELEVDLGVMLPVHADAIGISPEDVTMRLISPGTKRKFGAAHWKKNHADTLAPDKALELLSRTVWSPSAIIKEDVRGTVRRIIYREANGQALAVFMRHGQGWRLLIEDAWEPTDKYTGVLVRKKK